MASKPSKVTNKVPKSPKVPRKTLLAEHDSLKSLQAEAQAGESLEDVMRRKCRAMVAHARSLGWSGPPFCPEELASIHGIRVEASEEDIGGEGRIFPRRGEVVIQYRAGRLEERKRFTICHEMAHTCFSNAYEFVRNQSNEEEDDPGHKKFENLCDVGAGELLMPHDEFSADVAADKMCLAHMDVLRARYVGSIEATLKRMLDYTTHPCAAVFLTDEGFKEFPATPGQMRVQWMWKNAPFSGYLRQGTLAPRNSGALQNAPAAALPFSNTRETWWINGKPRSWYVETIRLPSIPGVSSYAKVVALLHTRLQ